MPGMHESTARLYLAVEELCEGKVRGQSAVARLLGQKNAQVVKNWENESRGVSLEGALAAQAKLGCDANWVLTGAGTMIQGWPFAMVRPSRFFLLQPEQKSFVEGQLAAAISECERAPKADALANSTDAGERQAAAARRALARRDTTGQTKRR